LFGRNTTAGAVLIEPNKASIDEGFNGNAKVTLDNYNLQQLNGMVNIPLNDVAAIRIAGEHKKRDGYTTNILTGQKWDGVGNDSIRISLLLKPTRDISSHTIIDYLDEDASPTSSEVIAVFAPNGGFGLGGLVPASAYAGYSRILGEQQARGPWKVAITDGTNGPFDMLSPSRCTAANPGAHCRSHALPKETLSTGGILNNTQIEFDGFTIKNIVAFRRMHHRDEDNHSFAGGSPNGSLAPSGGGDADVRSTTSQWQEEFQLLGKAFDNRLDWQTGLFMMREWGSEFSPAYTNSTNWSQSIGYSTNESKGIFAQGTYALTDKLKGTLGVRKNWDHRDAKDQSDATNSATGVKTCQVRVGATAAFLPITNCIMAGERDWQANTYTMALDYQVQDHTLLYVKHDRGYKSGGFSLRSHRIAQFAYDPEFVLNTEVGVKADWSLFDRPIRTNFALFTLDYTNQQLQVTNAGTNPVTTYVANVGKSQIRGAEFEVTYKATKRLELSGYWSYANPKYLNYATAFAAGGPVVDLSGRPWALPRYQANLAAAYTLPLDSSVGTVTARADATFRSKSIVDNSVAGLLGTAGAPPTAGFTQNPQAGFGLLNLRVDWSRPMGNPVDLALFVTNATNVAYIQGGTGVNGLVSANIAPPRMFGVELSYKFGEGFKAKD
jgi:iron complex outermembrane receptor protein